MALEAILDLVLRRGFEIAFQVVCQAGFGGFAEIVLTVIKDAIYQVALKPYSGVELVTI